MNRTLQALVLVAICLLGFTARLWNARDVFVDGKIYFADADCYSRMTRAQQIVAGHGWVIRHHDFENWPQGTTPHTTAPMDWLIVAGRGIAEFGMRNSEWGRTSVLAGQALDLAGALIGPPLGAATCVLLALAGLRLRWSGWAAPAIFCAVSPVLVHGTVLGRPDHQALLIPLLALALISEFALARALSRRWGIVAGAAWSLALWTSLYEPLVLLAVVTGFWLIANRRRFTAPEMRGGWLTFATLFAAALLIDGWRLSWPDATLRASFENWQQTIGELAHLDPRAPLLYRWLGAGIVLAPFGLAAAIFLARRRGASAAPAALAATLLVAAFALTVWQLRWGYFLALAFALSLPFLFALARASTYQPRAGSRRQGREAAPRVPTLDEEAGEPAARLPYREAAPSPFRVVRIFRGSIPIVLSLATLWPLAADWDEKLFPADHPEKNLDEQLAVIRVERVRLREVGEAMRSTERRPFLAPWWLSPPLAYWSGQPGVAGSSHESLPGIVASARFFLAPDAAAAERIARPLGVKWIVTDDAEHLTETSSVLLGVPPPAKPSFFARLHEIAEPRERVRAEDLRAASPEARAQLAALADQAEAAQLGTAAFSCVSTNQFYKLFSVKPAPPSP